jgi:acyl dehydratase
MTDTATITRLGRGLYFEDLAVGQRFETFRRTVTEPDLVNFISATGMLEAIFVDVDHGGAMGGRPVPAALTYSFIEGMQMQTLVQGTGMAMLEVAIKIIAAVRVGDSIRGLIEVMEVRPTSKSGRAVVTTNVQILNQKDEVVMTYVVKRLIAGRPAG